MYLLACGVFLAVAALLNLKDRRMLALISVVSINIFYPIPMDSYYGFYAYCIMLELIVAVVAVFYPSRTSCLTLHICAALILAHVMGMSLDGSPPLSPYRVIVKILECAHIAVCLALSPVLMPYLRNRDAAPT